MPKQDEVRDPLSLIASTIVQSNGSGGVNAISLKNPAGTPMEVLEVKFKIEAIGDVEEGPTGTGVGGGLISCKLDLGAIPMTNGFVPVWSFGRGDDDTPSNFGNAPSPGPVSYAWKLSKPLFVPVGTVPTPTFQHRGLIANDVRVTIVLSGRSLAANAKPPSKIPVPYAASWVSRAFATNSARVTDNSRETDLLNPFSVPLTVDRFTGRIGAAVEFTNDAGLSNISGQLARLKMVNTRGDRIIPSLTVFSDVFFRPTRTWETPGHFLEAHSFYTMYLDKLAALTLPGNYVQKDVQVMVGMVGYRYMDRDFKGGVPL